MNGIWGWRDVVEFWICFEACFEEGEGKEGTEVIGQQRLIKTKHWGEGTKGQESHIPIGTFCS